MTQPCDELCNCSLSRAARLLFWAFVAAMLPFAAHRNALGQSVAPAVTTFAQAAAGAHQAFLADAGRLWGVRLDTLSWMGVDGKIVYLTADPHRAGYAPVADRLWTGPLPPGIAPANTSVAWAGRRWAMVMLPVPADSIAAVRLLIHEAAHVVQPSVLPQPVYSETGAGSGLLDEPAGRTWLQLEWRALSVALRSTGEARAMAVRDALTFRAERYAVASEDERTRERVLDVTEGIPEYTAWQLTHSPRSAFVARLDSASTLLSSFVRGFPYYTGPAYAILLDAYTKDTNSTRGAWRKKLASMPNLQQLLGAALVSASTPVPIIPSAVLQALSDTSQPSTQPANQRAELARSAESYAVRYDVKAIRDAEDARWATRQRELADYRKRFVDGPTIRIRPGALNISFDPRRQASLGEAGTVMANLVWKSKDGAMLTAPGGALVTPTWSEVRVPLGSVHLTPGTLTVPLEVKGDGWALSIPAGWTVRADRVSWVIVPATAQPIILPARAATTLDSILVAHTYPLYLKDGHLTGAGGEFLVNEAKQAQFVLLGEEHGSVEIPQLASALLRRIRPDGYRYLALEAGPLDADILARLAGTGEPIQQVVAFRREQGTRFPFYSEYAADAALLGAVRSDSLVLWGLDQEFIFSTPSQLARLAELGA